MTDVPEPEEPAEAEGSTASRARGRTLLALFRRLYGESPWHLLVLVVCLAVSAYAAVRLLDTNWFEVTKWFVGAALVHDLVLVPLYAGTDWMTNRALRRGRPVPPPTTRRDTRTAVLNHLRVPAFLSLLLLLVYWPLVFQDSKTPYEVSTALDPDVFLGRWLLITAVVFAASAALFTVRQWRARTRTRTTGSSHKRTGRPPHRPR